MTTKPNNNQTGTRPQDGPSARGRGPSTWTRNYTPDQVREIRELIKNEKFSLIEAEKMVTPRHRPKIRAPKMDELIQWIEEKAQ